MKVVALRGVCIGVDRHLKPGDEAELDAGTAQFLSSIGAVASVPEAAAAPEPAPVVPAKTAPEPLAAKSAKKGT